MKPERSSSADAPIDDAFLAELAADYGTQVLRTLTSSFLCDLTTALREARVAALTLDTARLQHVGHRLRGAAGNFRARSLADAAAQLERSAVQATLTRSRVSGLVDALETEANRVRSALADRAGLDP